MTNQHDTAASAVDQENNDLIAAAHNIFEGGKNELTLSTGKVAVIRPAKMKQLTGMMKFFRDVIGALSQSQLAQMIGIISEAQRKQIDAGEDPRNIDLRQLAQNELLHGDTFGSVSIISLLLEAVSTYLPDFVVMFTNLTKEDYEELDIDEGALLIMGIISLNYDFFSQRLLPVFLGFMKSVLQQAGVASANLPASVQNAKLQNAGNKGGANPKA